MKNIILLGVALVVLGLGALVWPVVSYTETDKVVDIGPVEVTTENTKHVPIPPMAGGAAVVAGLVLVTVGARKKE